MLKFKIKWNKKLTEKEKRIERYDLVKIKQQSRNQSFRLRLRFRRLRSSENQIRKQKRKKMETFWLVYSSASAYDSDNLVFTRSYATES